MRTPNPVIASLLNLIGIGLGYIYLGRMKYVAVLLGSVLVLAILAGWLGLFLDPVGLYVVAAIAALISLVPFVHCPLLAIREKSAPGKPYTAWWFYAIWIVASWLFTQGFLEARPILLGYDSFQLPSMSMAPTLQKGDYITVDTRSFKQDGIRADGLYVFTLNDEYGTKYIKRIVGLPGDTIELTEGRLVRNGQVVIEPYLAPADASRGHGRDLAQITLGGDQYFVLGDNRANSRDSRYLGPIAKDQLHGTVRLRWFSYDDGVRWSRFPFVIDERG